MPAIPTSPLVLALAFATASAGAADAIRFDPADVDPDTAAPCTDLNAYANAKWLAANPVPADRTTWGTFERLDEASLATQRAIVEQAARAAAGAPEESIEHKVGVFYASAMDEAAIGRAGDGPIRATLARIGKLDTPAAIAGFVSAGFADGAGIPFRFYSRPDYRNSAMNIAYVAQGGLGLPERGYYLDDTPDFEAKRKALLEKYDKDKDGRLNNEERKAAVDAGEELPAWGGPGGPGGRGPRGERGGNGGNADKTDKPGQ